MKYVAFVGRSFLLLILTATGIGKALDVPGFAEVIATFQVLPDPLLLPAAVSMVLVELALAGWLLVGIRVDRAALASAGLHAIFTLWIAVALLRGLEIANCGCFGVFYARPMTGWTIVEDLVMVAVSLGTFFAAKKRREAIRSFQVAASRV